MIINPYSLAQSGAGVFAAAWNPADKHSRVALSNSDLTAASTGGNSTWASVRSVTSKAAGKWCAEIVCDTNDAATSVLFGVVKSGFALDNFLGQTNSDSGNVAATRGIQGRNGSAATKIINSESFSDPSGIGPAGTGGVCMLAVDIDAGKIWLGVDGTWSGAADPASGAGATFTFTAGNTYFLACSTYMATVGTLRDPVYVPSGFLKW